MSHSTDQQGWERFKSTIRALYISEAHPLEGPNGVIKLMESRYGFRATKAQYEKRFREWGFRKNRKGDEWKIIGQKVGKRERNGKESNVYFDGELVPKKKLRKEISRQVFVTSAEHFQIEAQETAPQTPPGFEIRTPNDRPVFGLVFQNLPTFQFQEAMQALGHSVKSFDTSLTALAPLLCKSNKNRNTESIISINSFLPNTAFLEEQGSTGIAIERIEELKPSVFLNLIIFLISNNFPGQASSELLYKWLKSHENTSLLKSLSSMKGPTVEALLEKFFRLAIEAEDLQIVRYFIEEGMSFNGFICRHPQIADNLTPLQFACIRGNTELAQELIKAGSSIDQPRTGWKSSALVLAILGEHLRDRRIFWDVKDDYQGDDDEDEAGEDRWDDDQGVINVPNDKESPVEVHSQKGTDCFFNLINSLIDAGASVNVDVSGGLGAVPWRSVYACESLSDGHSPLTAASKYRIPELVDLFIQKGADIMFLTENEMSALHECLYSWEEMISMEGYLIPLCRRSQVFPGSESMSKIAGVVCSLLKAGADVNDEYCLGFCENHESCDCPSGTTLDLSLLTGSIEIVYMILRAGARTTTEHSVEHAIEIGSVEVLSRLLSAGAPLSKEAIRIAIQKDRNGRYVTVLLTKRQNIRVKRAVLVQAIKAEAWSTIVHLFEDETSNQRKLFQNNSDLKSAIEHCCEKGHIDILRLILEKSSACGVSISPMFGSSLCMAASSNHDEVVDAILSAGMDVNAMTDVGHSALLAAIKNQNKRITEILINAGAVLNTRRVSDTSNCIKNGKASGNLLIAAVQWGDQTLIKNLVEAGADVNAFGNTTEVCYTECSCITPLTAAVIRRDFYLINYLISVGAKMNPGCDFDGTIITTLSAAVIKQDLELVDFLLRAGANPYDVLALEEATNNFEILQVLLTALLNSERLENGTNAGIRALNKAMEKQDQVMVRAIINSPLNYFKPIELALEGALLYDCSPGFEITRKLLISGADPNSFWKTEMNQGVRTPLLVAVGRKSPQIVQLLLDAGAQPDQAPTCGMPQTPLQLAVSSGQHDIVRKLLDHKADPNAIPRNKCREYRTPIQFAVHIQDIEMVRVLLQYNADPNTVFNENNYFWDTPLQRACKNGSKEIIELLLEHGANVNATGPRNRTTALQTVSIHGFIGIAALLLKHGADVNAPAAEFDGRTALEGAAEHGRIDMVQLLFNAGANISGDGKSQYESAMKRASENGHLSVRRLLESYHG